jgi:hypothetical protein
MLKILRQCEKTEYKGKSMRKWIVVLMGMPIFGFCLLAPLQQSLKEIEGILNYPGLNEILPQGSEIETISKVSNGYLITTDQNVVNVKVIYEKKSQIGPKKFKLEFSEAYSFQKEK